MIALRIADWPWVSAILYGLVTLICLLIIRLCIVSLKNNAASDQKLPVFSGIILVLLLFSLVIFDYQDRRRLADPFSVEVRSAIVSDSGPITMFMVTHPSVFGDTASPIIYLAYIQITNLQDTPSTLSEFKVAASKDPEGPWEELESIPLPSVNLYTLGTAPPQPKILEMGYGTFRLSPSPAEWMKFASLLRVDSILETELDKPIQPHSLIHGWVALDSLRHLGLTPGKIYFRITLRDTANKGGKYITPLPTKEELGSSNINTGSLQVTGFFADISSFHVKYYSDPFPSPEFYNKK